MHGTFAGLPEGSTVFFGAPAYTISYTGGDGNDVVLTAAPAGAATTTNLVATPRSEERRGGKEGRSRWSPYH